MNCSFEVVDLGDGTFRHTCSGVTRILPVAKLYKKCDCARALGCANLGEVLKKKVCETCRGRRRIKVFACLIHGQCTAEKRFEDIHPCAGCDDFKPPA